MSETTTRLAILDQGEPAVRILAALGNLAAGPDPIEVTTIVVHRPSPAIPWYAREADETLPLPAGELSPTEVVDTLIGRAVDTVWIGQPPSGDLADLVAACEAAGLRVVGPDSQTIRQVTDPVAFAAVAARAGVSRSTDIDVRATRRIEVDTLCDSAGTIWTLGARDVSVSRDGQLVLAEFPAADVSDDVDAALADAAAALMATLGYRGAAVVRFDLRTDGPTFTVAGITPMGRPAHALIEEATGASFTGLQLRIEQGAMLPPVPPTPEGHTIEVRLLAVDPDRANLPTGGRIRLLDLPVGTGVRIDASLRTDDEVDALADPVVATESAWGRDRASALARLRRAVERTSIVLSGGATNRPNLLALLRHPDIAAGPVCSGWYADQVAAGALRGRPDPVAVVAAAIEVYESDLALVEQSFRASASRGRPEHPEQVGSQVELGYAGGTYRLRVDRIAADRYRLHNGTTTDASVEWVSEHERLLTVGGRKHRVVAASQDDTIRLEIDGVAHRVTREDGVVVRTGWPALVESILVEPGQHVAEGEPVAVLESMKMVTTVKAPLAGQVTSVSVLPSSQVERGEPLLRIRSTAPDEAVARPSGEPGDRVDLAALSTAADPRDADLFADLENYLLGYDLDPAGVKGLTSRYAALAGSARPDDADLLASEDRLLDLFAEIGRLYRPQTEDETVVDTDLADQRNTQEFLIAFLHWLDPDRAGLPERYRRRLERALRRYGVSSLEDRDALESATLWMFRSFSRVPELAPLILQVLGRRLQNAPSLAPLATSETRDRLDRLVAATEGRQGAVADLARDVTFALFDEPVIRAVATETEDQMQGHLAALAADPDGPGHAERLEALTTCPTPLRGLFLSTWRTSLTEAYADPDREAYRRAILEAYVGRYYRTRAVHDFGTSTLGGVQVGHADYEHEDLRVHLVVGYAPWADLVAVSHDLRGHLVQVDPDRACVVDLVVWRDAAMLEVDQMSAEAAALLARCDFGRPLHRLDLTITSLEGHQPERERTQHLSFRQGPDGTFTEDTLYRNLHPMQGKRLDLWRLKNFDLTRLPSPEDVYLFDGVARDNPKDHRLFALAEVRDLTPVPNETTGAATYPALGRVGMSSLAAMRTALAQYPSRERPVANRLILAVRPPFRIPPRDWYAIASGYAGLARGVNLERVVLHVSAPEPGPDGTEVLTDKVLVLDGLGGQGLTVRIGEPSADPVRPLTAYAQKVLTAARFGVPYPYEIIRMLTPRPGDASPFPRGSFTELDLTADDALEPVDRAPGQNSAHLVVGLLTTFTEVHPEGMTRVALLSDPTQGLGNLAEPECRIVNAALAYAEEHAIPVEWYAVSSGALIAMDSGTENMDWISLTLRRIIEFTQRGGEINIVVTGINVGGQPYWNAEATMLMHTRGILVMTPASTMVLTGKQALDFSGAVSADDNHGIGGYDRVMGPNGQAQYFAPSFPEACSLLLQHYDYTYVVPGERFPRRRPTTDPLDRDVRSSPHKLIPESSFTTVGDVFDLGLNPERKQPFDMRSVMRSVTDTDCAPLERWQKWQDADTSIVWDATVGGIPVCMIGLESRAVPRRGFVPSYGPPSWTSGTLFPQSSRKTARAINATSGNRPLVVLANLSGFDGSPESMRNWQLEYGAEIGRAITNFRGPIVFVVVSRYHGGAFVVFSKQLTETMEIAAVEGAYASVIGGAPAAATVFAREVRTRTEKDERVVAARAAAAEATGPDAARLRSQVDLVVDQVRSERLREVADEFDGRHTIERAQRVGSVDRIIAAETLRPYVIDALERGMAASAG